MGGRRDPLAKRVKRNAPCDVDQFYNPTLRDLRRIVNRVNVMVPYTYVTSGPQKLMVAEGLDRLISLYGPHTRIWSIKSAVVLAVMRGEKPCKPTNVEGDAPREDLTDGTAAPQGNETEEDRTPCKQDLGETADGPQEEITPSAGSGGEPEADISQVRGDGESAESTQPAEPSKAAGDDGGALDDAEHVPVESGDFGEGLKRREAQAPPESGVDQQGDPSDNRADAREEPAAQGRATLQEEDASPERAEDADRGEGDAGQERELPADSRDDGTWTGVPSQAPRPAYGGNYLPPDLPRKMSRENLRRAYAALRKFVQAETGGNESSPRLCGRKLVRELVSQRYSLARTRRLESQRKRVAVLVDVSGSCSASCGEAHYAARHLASLDPRVILVDHSNGVPVKVFADRKHHALKTQEDLAEFLMQADICATIALGDWDAALLYAQLIQFGRLVWLDSYCATRGEPQRTPIGRKTPQLNSFRADCLSLTDAEYWTRCNTVADFLTVLEKRRQ